MAELGGIRLKKKYGQHFLRKQSVIDCMLDNVKLDKNTSVFEIGCGDGFLTKSILQTNIARLWIFEIDPEWASYVSKTYPDPRVTMNLENILDVDFSRFDEFKPWVLLANLPYQITFPLLHLFQKNRAMFAEGVIMVQEEVAQKITKSGGRDFGFASVYFQHFFEWKLLEKISPDSFYPAPKVFSRLLYFKPKKVLDVIPNEQEFWKFVKLVFKQPRRTIRNNLQQTHYNLDLLDQEVLALRAQQLTKPQLLELWNKINS